MSAKRTVQGQIEAYNAADLEGFLASYSDTIQIFQPPNAEPAVSGKGRMRAIYADRLARASSHVEILSRTVLGDKVVDHERLHGLAEQPFEAVVVYAVADGLIQTAWFFMAE